MGTCCFFSSLPLSLPALALCGNSNQTKPKRPLRCCPPQAGICHLISYATPKPPHLGALQMLVDGGLRRHCPWSIKKMSEQKSYKARFKLCRKASHYLWGTYWEFDSKSVTPTTWKLQCLLPLPQAGAARYAVRLPPQQCSQGPPEGS